MRITLTIDEDVLQAARDRAVRTGETLGAVITDLARESLRRPPRLGVMSIGDQRRIGRFALLPGREEVVTVEHVLRIAGSSS